MASQNNILSFGSAKAAEPEFLLKEEYRATVNGCRQLLLKSAPKLMEGLFEKLDDALYQLADKADSNHQQTAFFDTLRELRKEREKIESGFNAALLEGYDGFWKTGPLAPRDKGLTEELESEDFSLVENEELEEGLAINTMISRGENRYYRDLYALDQRFGYMGGGASVEVRSNPVAPSAFCHAFHHAIRHLTLDIPVKLVIYKQFEREVIDRLEPLYGELNSLLARADVLPKLARKVHRRPQHAPAGGARAGAATSGFEAGGYDDEEGELQAELYATLQQLLGQRRAAPTPAAGQASLPVIDSRDVIAALSSLQQATVEAPAGPLPAGFDVRANLLQAIRVGGNGPGERQIQRGDEDAIDVISMLFEFILEDRSLPDAMKALLGRLQIPMLKVAIIDKGFFARKNHPARRLLNSMAQAAIGWTEQRGRAEGGLYAKMESMVERVLTGFESDVELFTELNEEFTGFLEKEARSSQLTEQRAAQVTQGKEQLEAARHRVFEEINQRLFGRGDLPEVVVTLLKSGWKDVLLLIHLRKGVDSDAWREALERMDELLWSVQPKPQKSEQQQLLEQIPALLKALRSGLNEISFDQHRMAQLFKELQVCHVACLKGGAPALPARPQPQPPEAPVVAKTTPPATAAAPPAPAPTEAASGATAADAAAPSAQAEEHVPPEPPDEQTPVEDEYSERAAALEIGTWLEVTEADGSSYRAKLSWRSNISGRCLFVNRKGMKVAELSPQALADWFRSGNAVVIEQVDVPLMDRALSAMVKVLKETEPTASA